MVKKYFFIHIVPYEYKRVFHNFFLFESQNFAIAGCYSKTCQNPIKRKLHWIPACIMIFKK